MLGPEAEGLGSLSGLELGRAPWTVKWPLMEESEEWVRELDMGTVRE